MFDAYAAIRKAVTDGFHSIGESSFCEAHVLLSPRLRPNDKEILTAYPLKANKDSLCMVKLLNDDFRFNLLSAPLVSNIEARGGHILFSLTNEAYEAIMHRIIEESEPHGLNPLESAEDSISYAYMRMRTLSKTVKSEGVSVSPFGFGDDEAIRRALWGCFGIAERLERPAELYSLKEYVAHMALNMFSSVDTRDLVAAYNNAKQVSKCIAITLGYGLDTIE